MMRNQNYSRLKSLFFRSYVVRKVWYSGSSRYCPVCESKVRLFKAHGIVQRPDARCPVCYSLERHRAAWVWIERQVATLSGDERILHFAPSWSAERRLRGLTLGYVAADLQRPDVDVRLDISALPFADGAIKGIICSHVLEHIVDDRRAMKELSRVLDPDGWALIIVPITAQRTYEDATITEPADRLREFGQDDHVRRYGPDVEGRLEEWFSVRKMTEAEAVEGYDPEWIGIDASGYLFACRKASGVSGTMVEGALQPAKVKEPKRQHAQT